MILILAWGAGLIPGSYLQSYAEQNSCDDAFQRTLASFGHWNEGSALLYSKKMADRLSRMDPSMATRRTISSGMDQQDLIFVNGVPPGFRKVNHEGRQVFRHYTRDAVDAIVSSRSLKAGPRPFIDPSPHARLEYHDLTGSMFTTPDVKAGELWMDLSENADWVEFTFAEDVPVFWCKEKNYLVPMQKNYPDWIRKDYEEFVRTGASKYRLEAEYERIKPLGGMTPTQFMPIRIQRYQKNGVIHSISR